MSLKNIRTNERFVINSSDKMLLEGMPFSYAVDSPVNYLSVGDLSEFKVEHTGGDIETARYTWNRESGDTTRMYLPKETAEEMESVFDSGERNEKKIKRIEETLNGVKGVAGYIDCVDKYSIKEGNIVAVPLFLVLHTPYGRFYNPGYLERWKKEKGEHDYQLQFLFNMWNSVDEGIYNSETVVSGEIHESMVLVPEDSIWRSFLEVRKVDINTAFKEQELAFSN
jgi:hypothetical protein